MRATESFGLASQAQMQNAPIQETPALRLSVLDQSPVAEGSTGARALRNTIDLAQLTDELGYSRYWVAEHHGTPALAGASPEALIGPIAAATSRLRVGSGGVMLPHYSPLKVAETFSILSGLFPGRIDLGIGRAAGTDSKIAFVLQRDRRQAAPDDFPDQLTELLAYLRRDMSEDPLLARLSTLPGLPESPQPWLLGSSPQSALWAAEFGLPYVFADFINSAGEPIATEYHQRFVPSTTLQTPRLAVAASVICADTDEEAQRLSSSSRMMINFLQAGRLIQVPPVEKAVEFLARPGSFFNTMPPRRRFIVGSPATVRSGIENLAREYGAGEVLIVTITHDHAARRRSYELIAEAFQISPAATTPTRLEALAQVG